LFAKNHSVCTELLCQQVEYDWLFMGKASVRRWLFESFLGKICSNMIG
jgi:hypothetical protein